MTRKMYVMTICIALIMISITSAAPKTLTSFLRSGKLKEAKTDKLLQLRGGGADWRYFVAGGGAAAISHGITTPIDVVKTRMQTNPELYNGSTTLALKKIVADDGALFLLQGLGPTLVGYGLEGALKFGSYEMAKPLFAHVTPSTMVNYLLASCVAGALAAIVLCPAEEVRIRLVADPSYASGPLQALVRLSASNGPLASLAGFPAMCAKQVPYTMGKQVTAHP